MKKLVLIALAIFLSSSVLLSKGRNFKFGKLDKAHQQFEFCDYDSTAKAAYLFDIGSINMSSGIIVVDRHFRIKIINKDGMDYADFSVPYYGKDDLEKMTKVKGVIHTLNDNGEWQSEELKDDQIFKVDVNEYYKELRVSFPNAREGSIIELSYRKISDNYTFLDDWNFQYEIPVLYSSLSVKVPSSNLTYNFFINGDKMEKKYASKPTNFWELENIKALKKEMFVYNQDEYREKIEFQLGGYSYRQSLTYKKESVDLNSWNGIAKTFVSISSFDDFIGKKARCKNELEANGLLKEELGFDNANSIYKYFVKEYNWNGDYRILPDQSFSTFYESKTGSSAELNYQLYNLLNAAGYKVSLAFISTRRHGRINPAMTLLSQFNHTIVALYIDGEMLLIDGTNPALPMGILDENCLNINVFILEERQVRRMPEFEPSVAKYSVRAIIKEDSLKYSYKSVFSNQIAEEGRRYYSNEENAGSVMNLKEGNNWVVSNIEKKGLLEIDEPFEVETDLFSKRDKTGNYVYLPVYINDDFTENPFHVEERQCHIELPYESKTTYMFNYYLPDNYIVEELPENIAVRTHGNQVFFRYSASKTGRNIVVVINIDVQSRFILKNNYGNVKEFYSTISEKLKEPIVMRELDL